MTVLDTPSTGGSTAPAAKFPVKGGEVVVSIVDITPYHQHKDDEPQFFERSGKPKMGKRIVGLVVSSVQAQIGTDENARPVEPGELVSFFVEGSRYFDYEDAKKDFAERQQTATNGTDKGDVQRGDVMRWAFADQKPPSKPGYTGQKVYDIKLRRPDPAKDGDLFERCLAAYRDLQSDGPLDSPAESQAPDTRFTPPDPAADAEDPF